MDVLRPGLLGVDRHTFTFRYCARHLIPVDQDGAQYLKWCNTGLSHGRELHALLKQVMPYNLGIHNQQLSIFTVPQASVLLCGTLCLWAAAAHSTSSGATLASLMDCSSRCEDCRAQ